MGLGTFKNCIIAVEGKGGIHHGARFLTRGAPVSVILEFRSWDFQSSLDIPCTRRPRFCGHVEKIRHRVVQAYSAVCAAASLKKGWALQGEWRKSWLDSDSQQVCVALGKPLPSLGHHLVCWQMNTAKMSALHSGLHSHRP